jgi:DNA-nicking Smr family endonuclease
VSRAGRRLSPEEAELWARVARTVTPLHHEAPSPQRKEDSPKHGMAGAAQSDGQRSRLTSRAPPPPALRAGGPPPRAGRELGGLDASWERKLARGLVHPDLTLDLHGASLEAAHARLLHGLAQARAMGARVVLLITGKARPVEPGERGRQRGVIRAKVIDWLAASEHARAIAAIRGARRRHGGPGALYIVLKRRRS